VFPAKHYVTPFETLRPAWSGSSADLHERLRFFERHGKLLEQQRLRERTMYDLEMLRTLGYCSGIENYSRYLDGRAPGEPPFTLLDYLPDDALVFLDESHVMVPQIRGMYNGDQARKRTLVDYGFRLPAAWTTGRCRRTSSSSASARWCSSPPPPPTRSCACRTRSSSR
jgi:excinuclease ABC subunit B